MRRLFRLISKLFKETINDAVERVLIKNKENIILNIKNDFNLEVEKHLTEDVMLFYNRKIKNVINEELDTVLNNYTEQIAKRLISKRN